MNKENPVVWFEIYVKDMSRAQSFYETVLNVALTELPNPTDDPIKMMAFPSDMTGPGASGALVYMEGFEAGGSGTMVYFHSEDCAIEENRIESAGGKVLKSKFSLGEYGFCSIGFDSEGNMFGIHSMQ